MNLPFFLPSESKRRTRYFFCSATCRSRDIVSAPSVPGTLFIVLGCFLLAATGLKAQSVEFLPEIDTYVTLNTHVRASFQLKQTREGGDPTQAEIGPTIEFYLPPWIKLRNSTIFDLDEATKRAAVFSVGYRILPSPDTPATQRMTLVAKTNVPAKWGVVITDRNRADLDWIKGAFDWRYRNLLSLEKSLRLRSYHPKFYVRSEEFYESRYQKWSTTALYAGETLPLGTHIDLSPYYVHQNNTGKKPNQQLNQIGLISAFYFSLGTR